MPIALLISGLWIVRTPSSSTAQGVTLAVAVALIIRNLSNAGSEVAGNWGAGGCINLRACAACFAWLAAAGVPIALLVAGWTGRMASCMDLISNNWRFALPMHSLTMLLSFAGGICRIKAKGKFSLTLCSSAYATPLVVAPALAAGINLSGRLFPYCYWIFKSTAWCDIGSMRHLASKHTGRDNSKNNRNIKITYS